MSDTIQKPSQKTHTPPAKQWRNWWKATRAVHYVGQGIFQPGDVFPGTHIWPSKEIAEQKATDSQAKEIAKYGHSSSEHIAAEPVE